MQIAGSVDLDFKTPLLTPAHAPSWSTVTHAPLKLLNAATKHVESYKMSYKRMRDVRKKTSNLMDGTGKPSFAQKIDIVLTQPEHFRYSGMRWLVGSAKVFEELAEACGESNAYIERLVRNLLSAGNKTNFTHMLGGGVGRVVTALFYGPGFAMHKAAGLGLYGLSLMTTVAALALSMTPCGKRASPEQLARNRAKSAFDRSVYSEVSTRLAKTRTSLLNGLGKAPLLNRGPTGRLTAWAARYYARKPTQADASVRSRRTHSDYMWKNRHQYGRLTRGLLNASYYSLLVINRLGGSFDKYLGSFLAKNGLSRRMGEILGNRVGLTIGFSLSFGLSFLVAPLVIGTSGVAACACAFSFLALMAAKANVRYRDDWKGELIRPAS